MVQRIIREAIAIAIAIRNCHVHVLVHVRVKAAGIREKNFRDSRQRVSYIAVIASVMELVARGIPRAVIVQFRASRINSGSDPERAKTVFFHVIELR